MKKDIHPSNYREVVFKDMPNGETFITRSTVAAKETIEIDGVTYPLVKLEITRKPSQEIRFRRTSKYPQNKTTKQGQPQRQSLLCCLTHTYAHKMPYP